MQLAYSEAQMIQLPASLSNRHQIKLLSASGTHASAFLHVSDNIPGCSLPNPEFEIVVQLGLNSLVHVHLPPTCVCGEVIDSQGDHLMKCRRGSKWDMGHTALNQWISSIVRSAKLPVSLETLISQIAPQTPGFSPHREGWSLW